VGFEVEENDGAGEESIGSLKLHPTNHRQMFRCSLATDIPAYRPLPLLLDCVNQFLRIGEDAQVMPAEMFPYCVRMSGGSP
jgi:hypothetical protein